MPPPKPETGSPTQPDSMVDHPQRFTGPWVGACLWLCCFQFFIAEQIARLGWTRHYSMKRDYISDLGLLHCIGSAAGSACATLHWVMNSSFVLQGFLIFFGAALVPRLFPDGWVYRIALALLALAGLGVLLVGLVPGDINVRLHLLGAAANFLGGNLAMILLGLVGIRRSIYQPVAMRRRGWITFAAGSVGLLAALALGLPDSLSWNAGTGAVERLAAYPLPLWLTWTGFRMLKG
jgi:hypothetical membrane protein